MSGPELKLIGTVKPQEVLPMMVIITWEDSRQSDGEWRFLSRLPDFSPVVCKTLGWLLKDGRDVKVVAQTIGDLDANDHQASGVMVIPTRAVLSVEHLVTGGHREVA